MRQTVILVAMIAALSACADELSRNFFLSPPALRPRVHWFPVYGHLTKDGITADLEAMARTLCA